MPCLILSDLATFCNLGPIFALLYDHNAVRLFHHFTTRGFTLEHIILPPQNARTDAERESKRAAKIREVLERLEKVLKQEKEAGRASAARAKELEGQLAESQVRWMESRQHVNPEP